MVTARARRRSEQVAAMTCGRSAWRREPSAGAENEGGSAATTPREVALGIGVPVFIVTNFLMAEISWRFDALSVSVCT